jgi:hypothetical protein
VLIPVYKEARSQPFFLPISPSTFLVVGGRLLEYHILLFHRVRKLFYIFLFLQNKFLNYLNNCCNIRKLFYITITLIHEMQKRKVQKGLATLCMGGGMGIAMCIERNFLHHK